jgi:hypothetical protein
MSGLEVDGMLEVLEPQILFDTCYGCHAGWIGHHQFQLALLAMRTWWEADKLPSHLLAIFRHATSLDIKIDRASRLRGALPLASIPQLEKRGHVYPPFHDHAQTDVRRVSGPRDFEMRVVGLRCRNATHGDVWTECQ